MSDLLRWEHSLPLDGSFGDWVLLVVRVQTDYFVVADVEAGGGVLRVDELGPVIAGLGVDEGDGRDARRPTGIDVWFEEASEERPKSDCERKGERASEKSAGEKGRRVGLQTRRLTLLDDLRGVFD